MRDKKRPRTVKRNKKKQIHQLGGFVARRSGEAVAKILNDKDRVCKQCSAEFVGDRFTCPQCRHQTVKASGKFGAEYHRKYYRKYLGAGSKPREPKNELRRAALASQTERIHREMKAIRQAGLDPDSSTMGDIIAAGVALEEINGPNLLGLCRLAVR